MSIYTDTDYRLWVLLAMARDALLGARAIELAKHHISATEFFALFVINDIGDAATPADISRRMFRRHNTVSALLQRMTKKGLVKKSRDTDRGNIWRIKMTTKGEEAFQQAAEIESIHLAMSSLSELDKLHLESYLRSIRRNAITQTATPEPPADYPYFRSPD